MTETEKPERSSADTIENVIGPFASLVEDLRLGPNEVRDESELPRPRKEIAEALLSALSDPKDHPYSPAQLKGWLLELAQFLPDVGPPICDPAAELARRMAAAKERHEKVDPRELQKEIETLAQEQRWASRRPPFRPRVEQERTRLLGLLASGW